MTAPEQPAVPDAPIGAELAREYRAAILAGDVNAAFVYLRRRVDETGWTTSTAGKAVALMLDRPAGAVPDTGQAREPAITFDDEVSWLGRRYVAALNAVLCARPDSPDVDRWRGHAEAYRQVAEQICRDLNRPAPPFGSEEWRAANGVYSEEYLAELRGIVRRSAGPSGDTVQAPDVAALSHDDLVRAIADPGSFLPRGHVQPDGASDYSESISSWGARAVRALLGPDTTPDAGLPLSALFDNRDPQQDEMRANGDG